MPTYLQGLTIGLAYVAPIGMQNLFVINSALTQPRRRALLTALIVIAFDISLALACFFGIGALVERFDWLQRLILTILISFFSAKFNDKILRVINIVCGLIIIFYGAKLLLQFFQTLL